ncbi:MAG: hypothetical protein P1P58_00590, partial [Treponema sp.]
GVTATEYVITVTPQTDGSDDGRYVFTVKSGTVQKEYVVIVDTKGPTITPIEPQAGYRTDTPRPAFNISLVDDTLPIKSGTIKAHYKKEGGTLQEFSFSGLNTTGTPGSDLDEGKYEVYFSAKDELENTGQSSPISFFVDKADPVLSDVQINNKTGNTVMIKANDTVTITGKVRDTNNMKKVSAVVKKAGTVVHTPSAYSITGNAEQNFTFTVSYTALGSAANKDTYTVEITAEDDSGRTTQKTLTLTVDTSVPEIKNIFPAAGATVNKTIVLKGEASDDVGLATVTVTDDKSKVNETFNGNAGFNWSVNIDTTQYTGGGNVVFTVKATDLAGNVTTVHHTIKVDQESDKPKVTINSFEHLNSAKLAGTRKISGVVEDDDGAVKKVEINVAGKGYKNAVMTAGNTLWSVEIPNDVADDPAVSFKIKVTDNKDSVFESSDAQPVKQPQLLGASDSTGIGTDFNFTLDTLPPEIKNSGVTYTLGSSYSGTGKPLTSGEIVGNKTQKKFSIRVFAYDKSEIGSVSLKLGNAAAKEGTHTSAQDITESGKKFEAWDITDIDLTEEGSVKLEITVTDKSGFEKTWSEVIKTDFTEPVIKKTAPTDDTVAFKDMTIVGEFSDNPGSAGISVAGIAPDTLEYQIGNSGWTKKHEVNSKVLSELTKTGSTWEIKINDFPEYKTLGATAPVSPSKIYKIVLKLKGRDAAGNEVESSDYTLQFDPDGSTPMIEVLSPQHDDKLGKSVAISGLARTANPAAPDKVTKIKLRLRKPTDSAGTAWMLDGKDYGTGVEIVSQSNINFWSYTLPENVVTGILNSATDAEVFFQVQGVAGSTAGDWTVERKFSISSNVAQFSEIKQDSAAYVPVSKWIKGNTSHITGTVTHSSGIVSATTASTNLPSGVQSLHNVGTTAWFTDTSDNKGKNFDIPIDTTHYSEKAGEIEFTISAKDGRTDGTAKEVFTGIRLKYDNSVPSAAIGEIGLSKYNDKANKADFTGGVFTDFSGVIKDTNHQLYTVIVNEKKYAVSSIVQESGNYKVTLASASDLNGTGLYYMIVKKYDIISGASFKFEGAVEDSGSGPAQVKAELTITGKTEKAEAQATSIKNEAGNLYSFFGNLNTTAVPNGIGTLKITVTDGAGNQTVESIPVRVKNNPLTITKVTFNTDLSGNNGYENAGDEIYTASSASSLNAEQDYRGTIDVSSVFAYKNATKSELVIELSGGYGSNRTAKLYKGTVGEAYEVTSQTIASGNTITISLNGCFANEDESSSIDKKKIGDKNDQKLILVVTDGTTVSSGQIPWHAQMDMTVAVDVKDGIAPTGYILPMYYNTEQDNSLFEGKKDNGHIEYSKITALSNDHQSLSGKVVLRGIAYDNIRLSKIELTGVDTAVSNTYTSGAWGTSSLKIVSEKITNTGHYVAWEYVWDTGTPVKANEVTLTVTDAGGTTNTGNNEEPSALTGTRETDLNMLVVNKGTVNKGQFISFGDGEALYFVQVTEVTAKEGTPDKEKVRWEKVNGDAAKKVPQALTSGKLYAVTSQKKSEKFNIVPYVTSLARNPMFNTNRSTSGAYNLLRGEEITVTGFNLTGTVTATIPGHSPAVTVTGGKFNLPTSTRSGSVTITANGISAINNNSNNSREYNKQNKPNRPETDFWTDDIALDAWKDDEVFPGSTNAVYPTMGMAGNGDLYAAFSNYSQAKVYYSKLNGNTTEVFYTYDPPEEACISVTSDNKVNVLYSANYHGGTAGSWVADAQSAGGLYCYDSSAPWIYAGRDSRYFHRFELFYHDKQLQQFRNFRITRGNNNRIHITYYDTLTNSIKYSTVMYNDTGSASHERPWINLDGRSDSHDIQYYTGGSSAVLSTDNYEGVSRTASTAEYCAIALDTKNRPVVIYADIDTGTLRLARGLSNAPTTAINWKVQKVLAPNDPNTGLASDYFTAKIDSNGYLHIAFRNTKGQLCYVKSTNTNKDKADDQMIAYTFGTSEIIDDAGVWADLTLDGATPYISYMSKANAYDGIRIAYMDSTLVKSWNNNGTENEKGGWNKITVALAKDHRANNARTCIAVAPSTVTNWKAAVGYTPGNEYRVIKYIGK